MFSQDGMPICQFCQGALFMPPLPTGVANKENTWSTVQDNNQASQASQRDKSNRQAPIAFQDSFQAAVSSALSAQDGSTKGKFFQQKLEGGSHLVLLTLHASMLSSSTTQFVSRQFTIENATFAIMIEADLSFLAKRGRSFEKAKGSGFGKLKGMSGNRCRISTMICSKDQSKMQKPRGPFFHNFAEHTVTQGEGYSWNFKDAVDFVSKTFVLAFEIELLSEETVKEAR